MTITRYNPEKKQAKIPIIKRKSVDTKKSVYVYEFDNFDNFIDFCYYLTKNINANTYPKLKKSALYKFNSKYYLIINNTNLQSDSFKFVHYSTIEFGKYILNSDLFERKLKEYGTIIFKTNAIEKCIKSKPS